MAKKEAVFDAESLDWDIEDGPGLNTPYQVEIPLTLHTEVMAKSKEIGIKVAPFVRETFRMFRDTPADQLFKKMQIAKKGE